MSSSRLLSILAIGLGILICNAGASQAQTNVYQGRIGIGQSTDWFLPSNWSLGVVPTASHHVLINNGEPADIGELPIFAFVSVRDLTIGHKFDSSAFPPDGSGRLRVTETPLGADGNLTVGRLNVPGVGLANGMLTTTVGTGANGPASAGVFFNGRLDVGVVHAGDSSGLATGTVSVGGELKSAGFAPIPNRRIQVGVTRDHADASGTVTAGKLGFDNIIGETNYTDRVLVGVSEVLPDTNTGAGNATGSMTSPVIDLSASELLAVGKSVGTDQNGNFTAGTANGSIVGGSGDITLTHGADMEVGVVGLLGTSATGVVEVTNIEAFQGGRASVGVGGRARDGAGQRERGRFLGVEHRGQYLGDELRGRVGQCRVGGGRGRSDRGPGADFHQRPSRLDRAGRECRNARDHVCQRAVGQ